MSPAPALSMTLGAGGIKPSPIAIVVACAADVNSNSNAMAPLMRGIIARGEEFAMGLLAPAVPAEVLREYGRLGVGEDSLYRIVPRPIALKASFCRSRELESRRLIGE